MFFAPLRFAHIQKSSGSPSILSEPIKKKTQRMLLFLLNIMDSWNLHVLTMRISALSLIETLSSENMKSGCLTACDFQQSRNGWLSYRPYVPSVSQCEFIRKLRHLKEQSCVGNWMEPFVMASPFFVQSELKKLKNTGAMDVASGGGTLKLFTLLHTQNENCTEII